MSLPAPDNHLAVCTSTTAAVTIKVSKSVQAGTSWYLLPYHLLRTVKPPTWKIAPKRVRAPVRSSLFFSCERYEYLLSATSIFWGRLTFPLHFCTPGSYRVVHTTVRTISTEESQKIPIQQYSSTTLNSDAMVQSSAHNSYIPCAKQSSEILFFEVQVFGMGITF